MKIQSSSLQRSAMKTYQQQEVKPRETNAAGHTPKRDELELSGAAKALSSLMKDGTDEAEISQRALEIKAQLKQGTYKPSVDKLAEALTERLIQERKAKP